MTNKVLLSGITGQAGSYLAEILLEKNYDVYGILRRGSTFTTKRIDHIFDKLKLYYGDLSDGLNIYHLIDKIKPDYVINAGAMSHVKVSFDIPVYTADVTGVGAIRILEAIKEINPKIKFIQFSSSELFGKVQEVPQKETTPFYPRSPYAVAKLMAYWATINYREAYNMWAANAIFFNMESPKRGHTFVTQKIIDYVKKYKDNININPLQLGNLDAQRDWGYCREYMEYLSKMMELDKPEDILFATNETHTVREFCELAFKEIGIELVWNGTGKNEMGFDSETKMILVTINSKYFRPTEVDLLIGDYNKAKKLLGFEPKIKLKDLIKIMINGD